MFHFEMPYAFRNKGPGAYQQAFSQPMRYSDRCILHKFLQDGRFGYGPNPYRYPNVCPRQD
jgi:hypothetical protein